MATPPLSSEVCKDSVNDTTEIARKALLTMSRHEIPVTPENYRVWYEYMIGSHEELNREIDGCVAAGARFDDTWNRQLYEKYFGEGKDRKLIEEVSQATFKILKEALKGVIATGNLTKDYAQRLDTFVTRLEKGDSDPGLIKEMIQEVILDTRKVEQSSTELARQLENARQEADELRLKLEAAEREATRDVLTGLYNRKYLNHALQALFGHHQKEGAPFSVIMMDIDHFKRINDTHGHKVGDSVLEFMGHTITGSVKGRDVPARYGGEEFVVLLPATRLEDARTLADSIRIQISKKTLKVTKTQETIGKVTVSCGVAQARQNDTADALLERADQALYFAKQSGRNNVKSEQDLPVRPDSNETTCSAG